jgi:hypothetical protein
MKPQRTSIEGWVVGCCVAAAIGASVPAAHAQRAEDRPAAESAVELIELPANSPLVSIRVMVRAGSIYDPPGKEGLSALTALMLGASGTARRSYAELAEAFYPMAAGIGVQTGREVTVFTAQVHRETLADFCRFSSRRWSSQVSGPTTSHATGRNCSPTSRRRCGARTTSCSASS